jgi:hypothetical protein
MINRLLRQDKKLLDFEAKIDRQNKELLDAMWIRDRVKEMVLQRMKLGGRHLIYTDFFEFATKCDCHTIKDIPENTHFTSFIYIN